ncbi:Mucin-19 [Frankliniella fusca]|uniref:Mucin-19 n=1 Tax=Frankliniella fusca TaxID=407009 RepID=A0AAE1HMF7_9NEOP|nr:Mucin-19 [Frankliniella fusca]
MYGAGKWSFVTSGNCYCFLVTVIQCWNMYGLGSSRGANKRKFEYVEEVPITLRVSNLPNPFMKQSLLSMLRRSISPRPAIGDLGEVSDSFCPQSNSVIITVKDIAIADALVNKPISWYKKLLVIERVQLSAVKDKELKNKDDKNAKVMKKDDEILEMQPALAKEDMSMDQSVLNNNEGDDNNATAVKKKDDEILEVQSSIANEDMSTDQFISNYEVDETSYSRYVKISGIPPPFEKLLFLPFIELERRKANIDEFLQNAVVSCSVYDADDMSVTVEFLTHEQAQKFCELPIYFLKRHKLHCHQVKELSEASALVKVSGISFPFVKELFVPFLEAEIHDAKLVKDDETAIINCSEYDADKKSVILELLSAKLASDFCKLTPISFICDTLHLESYVASTPATSMVNNPSSSSTISVSTSMADKAGTSTGASASTASPSMSSTISAVTSRANKPGTSTGAASASQANNPGTTSTGTTASTSLTTLELSSAVRSDWSTHTQLVLLKFMIENRDLLLSTANRKKGEGFQNVMSGMKHFNLNYSENCVRRRMKALVSCPPPEAKTAVQEYIGEVPMGSSQIDELITAHPDNPKVKPVKLSLNKDKKMEAGFIVVLDDYNCKDNSNLFPGDSETCLIQAYIKLKPKFDDDKTRSSLVYSEMLEIMHKEGYTHLKVDDLSTRMGGLAKDFKFRYDSLLNRTGSGTSPTNWPHFDLLSQLYENSVIIEPQKIRSFGSSFANFSRDVRPFAPKKSDSPSKPTTSKFLNARHNERLEIQRGFLAEMKRQNDLNELRLQKDA